jgi:hypothetical protein
MKRIAPARKESDSRSKHACAQAARDQLRRLTDRQHDTGHRDTMQRAQQ